jgi:WD40 repeat protein
MLFDGAPSSLLAGYNGPEEQHMLQFRTPNYNGILNLSFLNDGRLFVQGYNKIGVWTVATDERQEMEDQSFEPVVLCPDGRGVIMNDGSKGLTWFPFDSTDKEKLISSRDTFRFGQITPDEQHLATVMISPSDHFQWYWWRVDNWESVKPPVALPLLAASSAYYPTHLKFSPNGEWLALCGGYGHPLLVHLPSHISFRPKLTSESNLKLVFNPDSQSFVAWSVSRLNVVNLQTREIKTFSVKSDRTITAAAFTADGRHLLTVGNDKTVRALETTTFREVHSYAWPIGKLLTIAISPDGLTAAIAGRNSKVIIWDLDL